MSLEPDVTYGSADRDLFLSRLGVDLDGFELPARPRAKITEIQRAVCELYDLDMHEFLSKRQDRSYARPRQLAMWLCRELTINSLPGIGRRFGNRDHTTVLHACRKVKALRATDPGVRRDSDQLLHSLRLGGGVNV